MRHRTAITRGILATGATLLLLAASAAPVGAGSTLQFKIEVDLDVMFKQDKQPTEWAAAQVTL